MRLLLLLALLSTALRDNPLPLSRLELVLATRAARTWAAHRWPGEELLTVSCWRMPRTVEGFAHCYVRTVGQKDSTLDCIMLVSDRHPTGFCEGQDDE